MSLFFSKIITGMRVWMKMKLSIGSMHGWHALDNLVGLTHLSRALNSTLVANHVLNQLLSTLATGVLGFDPTEKFVVLADLSSRPYM
jgi:hypothetical protein